MNMTVSAKYVSYIVLFVVFILVRINYNFATNAIYEADIQGLGLSSASFPFGIIKETVKNSFFSPIYYILIHFFTTFFKNAIIIKSINALIALINVYFLVLIGKKLKNSALGLFLGFFLTINQFYLFYTNQISPYCLNFLITTLIIYYLITYFKKPNEKNFKKLSIINCIFILLDNFGIIFVACELLVFYLISEKKEKFKKRLCKLSINCLFSFIAILPILIAQYYFWLKQLIPGTYDGIGFNLNSLYLSINEFMSPYLSFNVGENQSKSTLGMLYSYFINPDFKSLNTIKIAITLFYSSILPMAILIYCLFKSFVKNFVLKILFYISLSYLCTISLLMLYQSLKTDPIYLYPLFIFYTITLGYGIFQIKDIFIRTIIIASLFLIQIINPNLNSFYVVVKKNNPTVNVLNTFVKDFSIDKKDLIIMPYLGKYAKLYYKDLNILDFDYSDLKTKKGIVKELTSKNAKTINKYNINYLLKDYLEFNYPSGYLTKFFIEKCLKTQQANESFVLFIDKANSRILSNSEIIKHSKSNNYSIALKKIDYKKTVLNANQTEVLYDALKSRTLYNFIYLLNESFYLSEIAEYKKIDNEYFKLNSKTSLAQALYSNNSDYAFFIFKRKY